jgi:RNA polymerase sigma-70 factor (ECF subfamily)
VSTSFQAIHDAHFEFVERTLERLGVREADVPDETQKAFLVAYAKLPGFEGRSQLRSWLFSICRRVASDYRRSASVRREVTVDPRAVDELGFSAEDPLCVLVLRGEARRVLARLPARQRDVLMLSELLEMRVHEVADELGIPPNTVRSRLRVARASFSREVRRLALGAAASFSSRGACQPPQRAQPGALERRRRVGRMANEHPLAS